jgi:hypothetical protein
MIELTLTLTDDQLEHLAHLIAERVQPAEAAEFVDAAELARRLGVSKDAV